MQRASAFSDLIVKVSDVTTSTDRQCAAYTMDEVGDLSQKPTEDDLMCELVALHGKGLAHGDPRLPNLIKVGGVWKWIDLQSCFTQTPQHDVLFLRRRKYPEFRPDRVWMEQCDKYAKDPTPDALISLLE